MKVSCALSCRCITTIRVGQEVKGGACNQCQYMTLNRSLSVVAADAAAADDEKVMKGTAYDMRTCCCMCSA